MALRRSTQLAQLRSAIADQRRWIDEHGGDRSGYMARYGDAGDGWESIYSADSANLTELLAQQRELDGGSD